MKEVLSIANIANDETVKYFLLAQQNINKQICCQYAKTQLNYVFNAFENKEELDTVVGLSNYVVTDTIKDLSKKLFLLLNDQSGMYLFINLMITKTFHHFDQCYLLS